jgi:hypothetical protein
VRNGEREQGEYAAPLITPHQNAIKRKRLSHA